MSPLGCRGRLHAAESRPDNNVQLAALLAAADAERYLLIEDREQKYILKERMIIYE